MMKIKVSNLPSPFERNFFQPKRLSFIVYSAMKSPARVQQIKLSNHAVWGFMSGDEIRKIAIEYAITHATTNGSQTKRSIAFLGFLLKIFFYLYRKHI